MHSSFPGKGPQLLSTALVIARTPKAMQEARREAEAQGYSARFKPVAGYPSYLKVLWV